jgi:hypothetical protein
MKNIYYLLTSLLILVACTDGTGDGHADKSGVDEYFATADGSSESGGTENGGDSTQLPDEIEPGQITAGEWNDLENWDFWLDLQKKEDFSGMAGYWGYNLSSRVCVLVTNTMHEPAVDEVVQLLSGSGEVLWESKTDNAGKAELWPLNKFGNQTQAGDLTLKVQNSIIKNVVFYEEGINTIEISNYDNNDKKIDIAFVVDATGSMGDEMEFLKVELVDVINSVKSVHPKAEINLGSVFYRDEGDDFVTKKSDFSSNIDKTIEFIKEQEANGGGDFPEAVHTALDKSINELQWSTQATSRLLFLLLDAPPHYENQIVDDIHKHIQEASKKGIKIIPIVASGIDKETEFLMRYLAIASNGTYVFITDHSGIGGDHLEPSIGEYDVELLNKLLVRLISTYLE